MQGVHRLRRVSVVNLSEVLKEFCHKCAKSRKNSTLKGVGELSQGVHARTLFEVERVRNIKGDKDFKLIEEEH
jgi:hypothetical protein